MIKEMRVDLPVSIWQRLRIEYPVVNRFDVPLEFVRQTVCVVGVRDFGLLPMNAKAIVRNPMERRGRFLITTVDDVTKEKRKFWYEARKGGRLPNRRLGLVDRSFPGELVDWIARDYPPTRDGAIELRKLALRWFRIVKERGDIGLRLVICPGDF